MAQEQHMSNTAALASLLGSSSRLLLDAALDWHPHTLPMRGAAVQGVDFLNRLLVEHGSTDTSRAARARAVQLLPRRPPSSNCSNRLLQVQWQQGAGMPETLFLKLPGEALGTRLFCNAIRVWELECDFFRAFAQDFPLRLPRVYAVATRRSRFALLQENLGADASVRLFTNRDMLDGVPLALVRRCLAALAAMHARYHGLDAAAREQRLPLARHPFLSPAMSAISQVINVAAIAPCRRKAPQLFTPARAAEFRGAMRRWHELQACWYEGPLTLVHGDSHIGNFFGDGERMGMLDFQAPHWSKGMRDVQYFLINSLPADTLAQHEQELIAYYVDELRAHGVALSADEAQQQYRAFSFQTLMTIVTSLGLGPLTENDGLMHEVLARALAAVERLDFYPWLHHKKGTDLFSAPRQ
jgi:aminoglycoside phosphotransferase (APT) family kinase protein